MNDLDERLRTLVRTIGETAPEPPPLRADHEPSRRPARLGPLVAFASFVVVIGLFVGVRMIFGSTDGTPVIDGSPSTPVVVRHQIIDYTLTADLSCDQAVGTGTATLQLEVWADFEKGRFRHQATYPDGSTRDQIALGDPDFPTQTFGRGEPLLVSPACGDTLLGGDPTTGPSVTFYNRPFESPNRLGYEELGTIVAGEHTDSLGRPALLYRQIIDGFGVLDDGTDYALHQVSDWYVDETSGDVLETSFTNQGQDRFDVTRTIVVASDEETSVGASIFDTVGYQLEWDGDDSEQRLGVEAQPVQPSTTLGTDYIWPDPLDPAGPLAVAERFAREVLGWDTPTITPDPDVADDAPTWVTIEDDAGHQLTMLIAPRGEEGWGTVQIGQPTTGIGASSLGLATISPVPVPGATQITIHASTLNGTLAWQADLTDNPINIVLPSIQIGEAMTLIVSYQDETGNTVTANGGQFGP